MPPRSGAVISMKLATLAELKTVYGFSDLLNLYEIIEVDNINERRAYDAVKNRAGRG